MLHKDNNVGAAVILYGGADTCKSTICRIIAGLEAPWQMWGGTQWIQNDTLKWDTVTRTRSKTLITEEMVWQDVNKKIACENTLQMIKEQLTGAGAHNRQNKSGNKSNIEDQTSNLKYFLFSMNNSFINGRDLENIIWHDDSLNKRILIINMDEYSEYIKYKVEANKTSFNPSQDELAIIHVFNTKEANGIPLKEIMVDKYLHNTLYPECPINIRNRAKKEIKQVAINYNNLF